MNQWKVLLTTPDYYPKRGGLTTFSDNLKTSLEQLGHDVTLFAWDRIDAIKKFKSQDKFDYVFNVHFMGGYYLNEINPVYGHINFCHGSEILMTSPNPIKKFVKKLNKKNYVNYFENSLKNIAISNFTLNKLIELGVSYNISRDIVINNCIDLKEAKFLNPALGNQISLVCIARDVPHKNIDGAFKLARSLSKHSSRKVVLYATRETIVDCEDFEYINISGIPEDEKEEIIKKSHFNLLLSKDHSAKGFFEGFGLTILEAGKYGIPSIVANSGGLSESVHDEYSGWVLNKEMDGSTWRNIENNYQQVSQNAFKHTHESHSMSNYSKMLKELVF